MFLLAPEADGFVTAAVCPSVSKCVGFGVSVDAPTTPISVDDYATAIVAAFRHVGVWVGQFRCVPGPPSDPHGPRTDVPCYAPRVALHQRRFGPRVVVYGLREESSVYLKRLSRLPQRRLALGHFSRSSTSLA